MSFRFNFSNLLIEAGYQKCAAAARKEGLIITREQYWNTPGQIAFAPAAVEQLYRLGIIDFGYSQLFPRAVHQPQKGLKLIN